MKDSGKFAWWFLVHFVLLAGLTVLLVLRDTGII